MTDHVVRLYAAVGAVLVLFVTWAAVATRPWAATGSDPRVRALAVREQRLQARSAAVSADVRRRWAAYDAALARRRARNAATARIAAIPTAAPQVRVVTLPPLTVTRTS